MTTSLLVRPYRRHFGGAGPPAAILSPMPLDLLRSTCVLLLVAASGLLLLACAGTNQPNQSNPSNPSNPNGSDYRPSPIPSGIGMLYRQREGAPTAFSEEGDTVDELLAVVDGEVLTRQEVIRRLRLPQNSQERTGSEHQEIREERLRWAKQQLVIAAARRAGLRLPESSMDDMAMRQLKGQVAAHEAETEEVLSTDEYLANRHLTWEEYREQAKGDIIDQWFMEKLLRGIGPARPEVDADASPAEIRRIYYDSREAFNEQAGVRYASFICQVGEYDDFDGDPAEAEAAAIKKAEFIKGAFERGNEPWVIAGHLKLGESDWSASEEDDFITQFRLRAAHEWLLDPERKVGDATVIFDAAGPIVFGVMETRPERARTLEEVYDEIKFILTRGKGLRLTAQLIIEQLNRGSVIWPDELADELLDDAHKMLDLLATHDVLKRARLK